MNTTGDLRNAELHIGPDGLLTVTAAYTPTTHVHEPDSIYYRNYFLPILGPTSSLAFERLASWLPVDDDASIQINYAEFAYTLGTSPGRLTKALTRLVGHHLANLNPDHPAAIAVRRRVPDLTAHQLARLTERCPTLAACHNEHRHAA